MLLPYLAWDLLIIHVLVISIDGAALKTIEGMLLLALNLVRQPLALGKARAREL